MASTSCTRSSRHRGAVAPRGLGLWAVAAVGALTATVEASPAARLAEFGLEIDSRYHVAVLPGERMLRKTLDLLPEWEKNYRAAAVASQETLREYLVRRATLLEMRGRLDELDRVLAAAGASAKADKTAMQLRLSMQTQVERVQIALDDPTAPVSRPALRQRMVELSDARNALLLGLLALDRHAQEIEEGYQRLRAQSEVLKEIRAAGDKLRLGPIREYRRDLANWSKLSEQLVALPQPAYERDGEVYASLIVNETSSVTCRLDESPGSPSWLPSSALERCGVRVPDDAPSRLVKVGESEVRVRRISLPSLRIGEHVFREIAVDALPPDREDLGARLSPAVLPGYRPKFEPQTMTVELESAAIP